MGAPRKLELLPPTAKLYLTALALLFLSAPFGPFDNSTVAWWVVVCAAAPITIAAIASGSRAMLDGFVARNYKKSLGHALPIFFIIAFLTDPQCCSVKSLFFGADTECPISRRATGWAYIYSFGDRYLSSEQDTRTRRIISWKDLGGANTSNSMLCALFALYDPSNEFEVAALDWSWKGVNWSRQEELASAVVHREVHRLMSHYAFARVCSL